MTAQPLSRAVLAILWLAVAGWKAIVFLAVLGDFDKEWPAAVFALMMAGMTVWAAVQWRGWMLAGTVWPRTGLLLALVMLMLPLEILSAEIGE